MDIRNPKCITLNSLSVPEFSEKLSQSGKIVLVPHKNPDGDAIGSSLGLLHYLKALGKEVRIIVQDRFPYFLDFLPGSEDILVYEDNKDTATDLIMNADMIFCMDYGQLHRCGNLQTPISESKAFKVVIDHHPNPDDIYDFVWHEVASSSTCELVFSLITTLTPEHSFSEESATCLYTGLLTDTGCFKYALRPQTFETAARLLASGISVVNITTRVFDVNTPERIQLLGYTLNEKLKILPEYRTAYIHLTREELDRFQAQKGDTEGLVNYTLTINNILFGAFFHEREPGITKISFRSKGEFAVNDFSGRFFNGGGHRNAAGGMHEGPVNDAVQKFLKELPQYKDELNSLEIA